jgi:hypothetical protein
MIVTSTLLVASVALTGCSKPAAIGNPGPSGPSGSTPSAGSDGPTDGASPDVSETPSNLFEFTVDGAGPYQLDETLQSLRAAGLDQISAGAAPCPSNTTARGTGKWKDVLLSFHADGTLYMVTNRGLDLPTPSGVYLGTPLTQLKKIYAGITGQDLTRAGGNPAFLVTTLSGRGIIFELDPGKNVSVMRAGDSSYLKAAFVGGANYC